MRKRSATRDQRWGHEGTRYISLNTRLCQACWKCTKACPKDVIGKVDILFHRHAHVRHAEKCRGCIKCVKACPQGAIAALDVGPKEN